MTEIKKIKTKIKRLKCKWTTEMATELTGHFSIDAEKELTNILTEEIEKQKNNKKWIALDEFYYE